MLNVDHSCDTICWLIMLDLTLAIHHANLQLTISSTMDVTFLCTTLLALRVKFFVSTHEAFLIVKFAILTEVCVSKSSALLYQEILDKGLLSISRISSAFSVLFTMVTILFLITGLSAQKKTHIRSVYIAFLSCFI